MCAGMSKLADAFGNLSVFFSQYFNYIAVYNTFSAQRHIAYSPSIRLSVCLSDGWISQKLLKLGL